MLLDSNIIIYAAEPASERLREFLSGRSLHASIVTQIEVMGYHRLESEDKAWLEGFFTRVTVLPLDSSVSEQAIRLRQQRRMSLADAVIAGTALVHALPLVTRNADDFRDIPGIEIVNPFDL